MPKLSHEAVVSLIRNAPALIPNLVDPRRYRRVTQVRLTTPEFVDLNLPEYRADAVLVIGSESAPDEIFITEAQQGIDPKKLLSWPAYPCGVRLRMRVTCPVHLVVVALDPKVATWASQPIAVNPNFILRPRVIGPESIPIITDFNVARQTPELAVFSALAHANKPGGEAIALAALSASHDLDNDRGMFYPDFVLAHLGPTARCALEALMQTTPHRYQSDFARKYFDQGEAAGKAAGKAEALLGLLALRGLQVSPEDHVRIMATTDCQRLDTWLQRVLAAPSVADVLADVLADA